MKWNRLAALTLIFLTGCKNLTPEQNARLFDAGLNVGLRVADRVTK